MAKETKKAAPEKAAKAPAAPKSATKTASKEPKKKAAPNAAFMAPLTPSDALAAVIGNKPLPRTEIIKEIWVYIKAHNLQDTANKRMINADAKLKVLFDGKDQVSMFDLAKIVSQHVK